MKLAIFLLLSVSVLSGQTPASPNCGQRQAEDFVPMTLSERLAYDESRVVGETAFLYPAVEAAVTQALDRPKEWGQGARGFGLRYGSGYAGRFVGQAMQQGAAYFLHEDNRYFASGKPRFGGRLRYAMTSTFLARHDDGARGIAYAAIGGAAAGAFVTRAWQPRSTTSVGDAAVAFGLTMAVRTGLNVAREFGPRFIQGFLK